METQKALNSQSNPEKEKRSWRNQAPCLQTLLQGYSNQNSMVLSTSHQEDCTSLLDSLIHQRADSRSNKNYSPAACGMKTTFTER